MRIAHPAKHFSLQEPRKFSDRVGDRRASQAWLFPTSAGQLPGRRNISENSWSGRASDVAHREMEWPRLLDQFLGRALCPATEGYEQYLQVQK
jgi:hypothetical protein